MSNPAADKNMASYRRRQGKPRRVDAPFTPSVSTRPPLGRVLAEAAMLVFWCLFWSLNGWATISAAQALGASANTTFAWSLKPFEWGVIGGVGHVLISLIEGHLWRPMKQPAVDPDNPPTVQDRVYVFFHGDRVRLGFAVAIGTLDAASSAYYLRRAATLMFPAAPGFLLITLCAILATAIAIAAEPLIRLFGGGLVRLYKED